MRSLATISFTAVDVDYCGFAWLLLGCTLVFGGLVLEAIFVFGVCVAYGSNLSFLSSFAEPGIVFASVVPLPMRPKREFKLLPPAFAVCVLVGLARPLVVVADAAGY